MTHLKIRENIKKWNIKVSRINITNKSDNNQIKIKQNDFNFISYEFKQIHNCIKYSSKNIILII